MASEKQERPAELQGAAEAAARKKREDQAVRTVVNGSRLAQFLPTGKKKNERVFWCSEFTCEVCWDPSGWRAGKSATKGPFLLRYAREDVPEFRDAQAWFSMVDCDDNGYLNETEVANLYELARGEKLKPKILKQAMQEMDTDGSGDIEFPEFELWWKTQAGSELEKSRHRAFTLQTDAVQLLLVAPDVETKSRWVLGVNTLVARHAARAIRRTVPEPEPELEPEPEPQPEPDQEQQPEYGNTARCVIDPMVVLHGIVFSAATARANGEWTEAIKLYRNVIARSTELQLPQVSLAEYHTVVSECYEQLESFDDVLSHLQTAVRLAGNAGFPQRRRRSAVLMRLGRYPEAKEELEQALSLCPSHWPEYAEMQEEMNNVDEAVCKMPAVLWPGGPTVRVTTFNRVEAKTLLEASYLVYTVEVMYMADSSPLRLKKRYSQFEALHEALISTPLAPPAELLPSLPPKTWASPLAGKTDESVGEERTVAFHQYLRTLGNLVRKSDQLRSWLIDAQPLLQNFLAPPAEVDEVVEHGAAMALQANFRGRRVRRELEEKRRVVAAAMAIQATLRGRRTRRDLKEKRRIQEIITETENARLAVTVARRNKAAIPIQAAARARRAKKSAAQLRVARNTEAAIGIQALFRGHQVRARIDILVAEATEEAKQRLERRTAASVTIQCAVRRLAAKRVMHTVRVIKVAVRLQSQVRRKQAKTRVENVRAEKYGEEVPMHHRRSFVDDSYVPIKSEPLSEPEPEPEIAAAVAVERPRALSPSAVRWRAAIDAHVESARHHKTISKVVRAAKTMEQENAAAAEKMALPSVETTIKPVSAPVQTLDTAAVEGEAARLLRLQQMAVGVFQGTGNASVAAGRMSGSKGGVHGTAHNSTFETLQNVRSKWVRSRGAQASPNAKNTILADTGLSTAGTVGRAAEGVELDTANSGRVGAHGAGMTMRAMRDRQ